MSVDLEKRGEQQRSGKGYADRMTEGGSKPWIGGSRLDYKSPEETKACVKKAFEMAAAERKKR